MIERIEQNISQKAGLGMFVMVVMGFFGLVLSQPYISLYLFSFIGFFIALVIVSFFILGMWKVKEALESDEN
tara:strand:+ start:287 stop:502 length:216 start_codon:yes stop_codon:yes gene_type:complete